MCLSSVGSAFFSMGYGLLWDLWFSASWKNCWSTCLIFCKFVERVIWTLTSIVLVGVLTNFAADLQHWASFTTIQRISDSWAQAQQHFSWSTQHHPIVENENEMWWFKVLATHHHCLLWSKAFDPRDYEKVVNLHLAQSFYQISVRRKIFALCTTMFDVECP